MYKFEGAAAATGTVLHYRNATTGKRESYAVLESLISRNLKNLVIKPRSTLISREKEVLTAVGPGCKLSRQFLNSGSNDITDLSKSVLIQRIVQDKTTGKVFAQYQIASLSVLDPEMSKEAKATMTSEKWNTEITQDLQLMADTGRPKRECTLPKSTPKVEIVVEDAVPPLPVKSIKQKQPKKQKVSKKKQKRKTEVGSESNVELPSSDSTPPGPSASATPIVDVASIVNSAVQSALKVHSTASRDDSAKLVDVLTKLSSEFSSLRNEINLKAKSDVAVDTSTSSRKSGNKKLKRPVQQQESTEEDEEEENNPFQIQPFQQISLSKSNTPPLASPGPSMQGQQQQSLLQYRFLQEQRRIDHEHHLRQEQRRQQQLFSQFFRW
eukprot:g57621.t1